MTALPIKIGRAAMRIAQAMVIGRAARAIVRPTATGHGGTSATTSDPVATSGPHRTGMTVRLLAPPPSAAI